MDHSRAPVLEALQAFRDRGYTPFNPPGHRQGRGVDLRVLEVVGEAVFASDVISINGLDDRRVSQGVLADAQRLMADAVHADLPPWAMDADADLCVTSVHKSGSAIEQSSVFHLQGDRVDPAVLEARADLHGTTSPTSLVYATRHRVAPRRLTGSVFAGVSASLAGRRSARCRTRSAGRVRGRRLRPTSG